MYAIIQTGGKQYRVKEGDVVFIEKLDVTENQDIVFDKIVAISGEASKFGAPFVDGASVKATALKNGKGKKVTVFTYKSKKGYKRKLGHRQPYTKVRIDSINA